MNNNQELLKKVEELKHILVGVATGTKYNENNIEKEYRELRNQLLRSNISSKMPSFVRNYSELSDFWAYIKEKDGTYAGRRKILAEEFSQLINELEFVNPSSIHIENLKDVFSSEYISQQISIMISKQSENPTETIGKSKELIESCCKTIFEERNESYNKDLSVSKLVKETMKLLGISTDDMKKEDKTIIAILGNLHGIAGNIGELRNEYGSGHGKSASYIGLKEHHAKLAIGSSTTLVQYLWDVHKLNKVNNEAK